MRHRLAHRKLGRTTQHRQSLLRNLAVSLIRHERIRTTLAKAKELRPFAERLVTLGKRDSLHARRRALSIIPRKDAVRKLFSEIAPRFAERPGGYTRILKLSTRSGDGAEMAFIEFVDYAFAGAEAPAAKQRPKKEKAKKAAPAEEPEEGVVAEAEAKEAAEPTRKKKAKATKAKSAEKKAAPEKSTASAKKKTTKKAAKMTKTAAKKTKKKATKKKSS
jgi:large subunit ribosomal protein L17